MVIALGERDVFLRGSGAPRRMSAAVESDGEDGPRLTSSYDGSCANVFYVCEWPSCGLFFSFRWALLLLGLEVGLQVLSAKDISGHLP